MNLTSPSQVKGWCIENGFHPNRVMGQNFLIDRNALVAIVDAALAPASGPDAGKGAEVLEIGPGLGVLTEELLARGCRVTAIEKDPVLAARLAGALGSPAGLKVVEGDALEVMGRATIDNRRPTAGERQSTDDILLGSFSHMVSNLPYQAGTRILLELVKRREIPSMTVLLQTEVAERLAAREGSKVRGLAGVWTQLDYDVKIVRRVAAACFWPRPDVGSSVVTLSRHDRNAGLTAKEREIFWRLTKKAFEHRRKQLGTIFRDMVQCTARAEELANEDWINLSKGIAENEDT